MITFDFYKIFFFYSLCIQLIAFFPAFLMKTDKLTDLTYAATFIVLTCKAYNLHPVTFARTLPVLCITLWGLRLGLYLVYRVFHMKKDKRFDGIRESFWKFLTFFIIQGITIFCVALPSLLFLAKQPIPQINPIMFFLGLAIWVSGFFIETIADYQKFSFIKKNTGLWVDHGLWYYSRHPNYLGEILCWIGLYIYAVQNATVIESLIFFCASPLLIIILLTMVSGIPILEEEADRRWGSNLEYQKYKKETSVLFLLPKKNSYEI